MKACSQRKKDVQNILNNTSHSDCGLEQIGRTQTNHDRKLPSRAWSLKQHHTEMFTLSPPVV